MIPKIKTCNTRECKRIVSENGWTFVRQRGDHLYYRKPGYSKLLCLTFNMKRPFWIHTVKEFNLDINV